MNSEFQVPRADNALIGNPEFESTRAALLAPPITLSTPARQIVARTSFSPGVFPLGLSPREKNPPGVLPSVGGFLRRWYRWFPQGLAFAAIFWSLCFHVSQVRGSSMSPGILNSDRIVVDDVFHHIFPMGRGDVVVLKCPLDQSLDYVSVWSACPGTIF